MLVNVAPGLPRLLSGYAQDRPAVTWGGHGRAVKAAVSLVAVSGTSVRVSVACVICGPLAGWGPLSVLLRRVPRRAVRPGRGGSPKSTTWRRSRSRTRCRSGRRPARSALRPSFPEAVAWAERCRCHRTILSHSTRWIPTLRRDGPKLDLLSLDLRALLVTLPPELVE